VPQEGKVVPFVYAFDHKHRQAPKELKWLLGGKGANLAEMSAVLGLPVPPGFTISTDACKAYLASGWPEGLDAEIARQLKRLEKAIGRRLGDPDDPLLVSVRSGAAFSMPGMMDTVLNLGLTDVSVEGFAASTGDERFAFDSYRRFLALFGRIVLGVEAEPFDHELEAAKERTGATTDAQVPTEELRALCERYKQIVKEQTGKPFPQDPQVQLRGAIEAVFSSWNGARARAYRERENIAHDLGTAVNVQAMVFGNRDERSGTGVGFTRNASTGEDKPYGDFLVNAQGEDVVAGIRKTDDLDYLAVVFPGVARELTAIFARLEYHYRDMCDTEFTIEQGRLWMLQTRAGKRTGAAALRMAVEMVKGTKARNGSPSWKISKEEALGRVSGEHVEQLLHPQFAGDMGDVLTKGLGASPGAAVGRAYFTADDAVEAHERGEKVILVRNETSPEDIHGMQVAQGILTARGGLVSHAAVVARGWGIPAVVGADAVRVQRHAFAVGDVTVEEGDVVSLDGSTGAVMLGDRPLTASAAPPELETVLAWADKVRKGNLAVRANADTGADATAARELGAEGIGLCRTEHMFLGEERLPVVRRMILASTPDEEQSALDELGKVQEADFLSILEAMDGLPVTVRLLDPPLHEFLPDIEELAVKEATTGLTPVEVELLRAARLWSEVNPMLGTRGVRLGVIKPGLYAMQVKALMAAATTRAAAGGKPIVEIMIPLTVTREELAVARQWTEQAVAEVAAGTKGRSRLKVTIGTMIETPRAALRAGDLAEVADFFSFGTNDLTQMAFGFSRDDIASRVMPAYIEGGLLERDPFETIDQAGVGELVQLAAERGRAAKPGIKLGVCGEHGGDPESIGFFYNAGLDYVSCSPFRVPVARLAAAQAVLAAQPAPTAAKPAKQPTKAKAKVKAKARASR
jgi:pyruvate,orthophosphate dikinase